MPNLSSIAATIAIYVIAAIAEIGGCFSVWSWRRSSASIWWLVPGLASLCVFAGALTFASPTAAGRAYAAYGGIYVLSAIVWMVGVENVAATRADIAGGGLCLAGCLLILLQPR